LVVTLIGLNDGACQQTVIGEDLFGVECLAELFWQILSDILEHLLGILNVKPLLINFILG
jgi:hypothetical protein